MEFLAIIPARGGSKRVPGKNIKLLNGKPLIAHTIEAALATKELARTIVSTDDPAVAGVAKEHGAEVPFLRPAHCSQDTSSSLAVVLHALDHLKRTEGYRPDAVVLLQPTSPLRRAEDIAGALRKFIDEGASSVVSVQSVGHSHPYWMLNMDPAGRLSPYVEGIGPVRSQDLPPLYLYNGAIYVTRASYFDTAKDPQPLIDPSTLRGYLMDPLSSIDIDSPEDFLIAEAVLKARG